MALIKKHVEQIEDEFPSFSSLDEAVEFFNSNCDFDCQSHVIDEMQSLEGYAKQYVEFLKDPTTSKEISSRMASTLSSMDPKLAPIEEIMELLKLNNAYTRNLGISMLRDFGDSIKYYIVKFLIGDDRDLRIFAINVLGDVTFAESRDMLLELLETEEDINVAMTAVDYLAEIGEIEDIKLLKSLKERFVDDAYAAFSIDNCIKMIEG